MTRLIGGLLLLLALALPAPATAQGVTLDFPSWQAEDPGFAEWWRALIQEYESTHPGVKVKFYSIPFANYVNQLTVRFAGQNPPDIVHLPTRNFAGFASQNWLEPIDDLLKASDIPGHWTKLQSEVMWNGKTYGVLLLPYGNLLYYNEKILQDAKVQGADDAGRMARCDGEDHRPRQGAVRAGDDHGGAPEHVHRRGDLGAGREAGLAQGQQVHTDRSGRGRRDGPVPQVAHLRADGHQLGGGAAAFHRRQGGVPARRAVGVGDAAKSEARDPAVAQDDAASVPGDHGRRQQQHAPAGEDRRAEKEAGVGIHRARRQPGVAGEIRADDRIALRAPRHDQRRAGEKGSASWRDHAGGGEGGESVSPRSRRCARTTTSSRRCSAARWCACNPRRSRPRPSSRTCRRSDGIPP